MQAVAGHRVDEPGGVAGQEKSRQANGVGVDGERAENGDRRLEPGRSEARANHRIGIDDAPND